MNGLALCAGAGGLELGLKIALGGGCRCVCYIEQDSYAAAALVDRMGEEALDRAPVWDDLKSFRGRPWRGRVDILSAGYPCQPFSTAGKLLGRKDPRHLWPHVSRVIREARPEWVLLENVANHLRLGFPEVAQDLLGLGYRVAAGLFSALEVGAPHERRRLFALAHAERGRAGNFPPHLLLEWPGRVLREQRPQDPVHPAHGVRRVDAALFPPGFEVRGVLPLQPGFLGVDDGVADRLDRLRLCGNGVVPLAAALAIRSLLSALAARRSSWTGGRPRPGALKLAGQSGT